MMLELMMFENIKHLAPLFFIQADIWWWYTSEWRWMEDKKEREIGRVNIVLFYNRTIQNLFISFECEFLKNISIALEFLFF